MRAVIRLAGIAAVGVALYYIGAAHGAVYEDPRRGLGVGSIAVATALAVALWLLVGIVSGTGRHDAEVAGSRWQRRLARALWLGVTAYAVVGIVMFLGVLGPPAPDDTPFHNDGIALNECAARLVLQGKDPYASLDIFSCYDALGIGPDRTTPLRRGLFGGVALYPSDRLLESAWDIRHAEGGANLEFEWRPSYPALSFLVLVPWVVLGLDPNLLAVLLLLAAMALVVVRTERSLRGLMLTALAACVVLPAYTLGGSSDLTFAFPLVVAWLWRDRRWSAIALGVAVATKQLAWFAAPFYFLAVLATSGWREAVRRAGIALAVFAVPNLPFVVADPRAWLAGVVTPVGDPMFPLGAGLVFLSTSGPLPLLPSTVYLALEGLAFAGGLFVAWRLRRTSPEIGVVLAFVPLFFAWRSLFSYFFLLPLFAAAAVARMPMGELEPERADREGVMALANGPRVPAASDV